jgi:hypothetical protein
MIINAVSHQSTRFEARPEAQISGSVARAIVYLGAALGAALFIYSAIRLSQRSRGPDTKLLMTASAMLMVVGLAVERWRLG